MCAQIILVNTHFTLEIIQICLKFTSLDLNLTPTMWALRDKTLKPLKSTLDWIRFGGVNCSVTCDGWQLKDCLFSLEQDELNSSFNSNGR